MWTSTFIFALCSILILADFPHEIRHLNYITKDELKKFDSTCYVKCNIWEHMHRVVIMLKDGVDTCPENLLDNEAVVSAQISYKKWCKQRVCNSHYQRAKRATGAPRRACQVAVKVAGQKNETAT